jgi:PAS domain S-box-containing protein
MDASEATRNDQRATVTVDRDGIIHQWGEAVTEIVGYSADEAVGRSLNVVIPPVLRPLHWWGFDRAVRRGTIGRGRLNVPARCKDGRIIVARAKIELIPGKGGETEAAAVTFVGVAPRWQGTAWQLALAPIERASSRRHSGRGDR